jgi:hypothetical protein
VASPPPVALPKIRHYSPKEEKVKPTKRWGMMSHTLPFRHPVRVTWSIPVPYSMRNLAKIHHKKLAVFIQRKPIDWCRQSGHSDNLNLNLKGSFPRFSETRWSRHVMAVWPIKCLCLFMFTNFTYEMCCFILHWCCFQCILME